ncbi:MAG: excisionase family DNA-binding protein [Bdellovibrionaceae bacterium]|nr:excisionase family DNA-binding protein [Pseudobdellovibrionaceae bacterium]
MKKVSFKTMSFPIVLKRVIDDLVLSVPDLGVFKNLPIPREKNSLESAITATAILSDDFKQQIMQEIEELWLKTEIHRNEKKWQPNPSTFKQSLQAGEEDFSLPEFTKKLNEFISVSENTVRREISRGGIRCYQTEGGHRRIPVSELSGYLERIRTKTIEI